MSWFRNLVEVPWAELDTTIPFLWSYSSYHNSLPKLSLFSNKQKASGLFVTLTFSQDWFYSVPIPRVCAVTNKVRQSASLCVLTVLQFRILFFFSTQRISNALPPHGAWPLLCFQHHSKICSSKFSFFVSFSPRKWRRWRHLTWRRYRNLWRNLRRMFLWMIGEEEWEDRQKRAATNILLQAQIELELSSHFSLPCNWEQCLEHYHLTKTYKEKMVVFKRKRSKSSRRRRRKLEVQVKMKKK